MYVVVWINTFVFHNNNHNWVRQYLNEWTILMSKTGPSQNTVQIILTCFDHYYLAYSTLSVYHSPLNTTRLENTQRSLTWSMQLYACPLKVRSMDDAYNKFTMLTLYLFINTFYRTNNKNYLINVCHKSWCRQKMSQSTWYLQITGHMRVYDPGMFELPHSLARFLIRNMRYPTPWLPHPTYLPFS